VTQLGSQASENGPDDGSRPLEMGGLRLAGGRVLLGVGIAAALLAAGCGGSNPVAARVGSSSALGASKQLVAHYEPSQATGWPAP
jgi:hypothetical protein